MKLFENLYRLVMKWADHPKAVPFLGGLSFAESSFFPIPPDVMLIPMSLKTPARAYQLALLTTVTSVLGGAAGYLIGYFAFELIEPFIHQWGYWQKFEQVRQGFAQWGIWIIFVAGFSPVPYKIFTIAAGVLSLAFVPFILASLLARGARFYLVAGLIKHYGARVEPVMLKYIERIGWFMVLLLLVAILYYKT